MVNFKTFCLLGLTFLLSGCAQMAPPVPPSLELPKTVTDLKAVRKGDKVYLHWAMPSQTTDGESVGKLGATHICRSSDERANQCEMVGEVAASASSGNAKAGAKNEASYIDTLSADVQDPRKILNYSVSVTNESGRSAGLSNRVRVSATPTLVAPGNFKVQVTADGVALSWTAAASSDSEVRHFYRIYRRQDGSANDLVAGELPVDPAATQFVDHGFEWGKTYFYRASVVTEVSGGMHACGTTEKPLPDCATVYQVEGEDTPTIKVVAEDVFPPAVPSALQAVFSGEGQKAFVDLLWAPDTEGDLGGYNVYRHIENEAGVKINAEPVRVPAYRDSDVQSGKKYFYSVTAVDLRGNESGRSDEASESVP